MSTPLRLTVAGGRLGLETYGTLRLNELLVEEFCWSLPGLRFPLDLSGGVAEFRHRRGEVQRLRVRVDLAALRTLIASRLARYLGASAEVSLWPQDTGIGIGIYRADGCLSFDLSWLTQGEQVLRLLIHRARGTGVFELPLARALEMGERLLSPWGERRGRMIILTGAGRALCRRIAPDLGCRVPDSSACVWTEWRCDANALGVTLAQDRGLPEPPCDLLSDFELATRVEQADTALAQGDLDRARAGYMQALGESPRQVELTLLVAELDLVAGNRDAAALSALQECGGEALSSRVGAWALSRAGEAGRAARAIEESAAREPYSALRASLWLSLAVWNPGAPEQERLGWLDRAVAAAPERQDARRARLQGRAAHGQFDGSLADAQHLEACARTSEEKFETLLWAGRLLADAGGANQASLLFQRALKYRPTDPEAGLGLARTLARTGEPERAVRVLKQAVDEADRRGLVVPVAKLELARVLASRLGDYPQAIARAREVQPDSEHFLAAKCLEGEWRARLGDLRGAAVAYSELRQACECRSATDPEVVATKAWLLAGAELERTAFQDLAAAQQYLGCALRSHPRDPEVLQLYKDLGHALARGPANATEKGPR